MFVEVDVHNEKLWAELNNKLWPHHDIDYFLEERKQGHLQHEFLFMVHQKAVGFISLALRTDYVEGSKSSPTGYIEGIYVIKSFRNKGIGKTLIDFAKKWSIEKGAGQLASDTELENQLSIDFHNYLGFTEASRNVHFIIDLTESK